MPRVLADTFCSEWHGSPALVIGIGAMFQCGSRWASKICKTASFNGTQYGEWGHYESCVCPVSHLFLTKHLPNTSEFQWIKSEKRGPHCFPKQGQLLPSLTEGMIRANCAAWCVVPILSSKHECPLLPGCECLQGISAATESRRFQFFFLPLGGFKWMSNIFQTTFGMILCDFRIWDGLTHVDAIILEFLWWDGKSSHFIVKPS